MKFRNLSAPALCLASVAALHACGGGSTSTPTPIPTPAPTPNYPVIVAAGDISCDSAHPELPCKAKETSDLILAERALHPALVVLPLGDLQYEDGTRAEFDRNYNATWGRVNEFAHPVPGNHEYNTRFATGYFGYFQSKGVAVGSPNEGWYSYPIGDWRFLALNSNCGNIGGCNTGSTQYRWLEGELSQNRSKCTVAYMHHPFLSSGLNGSTPELLPIMRLLYLNNVDIVLAGHDHLYERFAPITAEQVADPTKGLHLFTVGTGGRDLYEFPRILPNSAFRYNENYGVLRITMKEGSYDWAFVNIGGVVGDVGSGVCF